MFEAGDDEDIKQNVNVLEKVLRGPLTGEVKRELNQLRRSGATGENLLRHLIRIYDQHSLKDMSGRRYPDAESRVTPRIICGEAFL